MKQLFNALMAEKTCGEHRHTETRLQKDHSRGWEDIIGS
jgi:hypothetical protein